MVSENNSSSMEGVGPTLPFDVTIFFSLSSLPPLNLLECIPPSVPLTFSCIVPLVMYMSLSNFPPLCMPFPFFIFAFIMGKLSSQSTGVGIFSPSSYKTMVPKLGTCISTSGNMMAGPFVSSIHLGSNFTYGSTSIRWLGYIFGRASFSIDSFFYARLVYMGELSRSVPLCLWALMIMVILKNMEVISLVFCTIILEIKPMACLRYLGVVTLGGIIFTPHMLAQDINILGWTVTFLIIIIPFTMVWGDLMVHLGVMTLMIPMVNYIFLSSYLLIYLIWINLPMFSFVMILGGHLWNPSYLPIFLSLKRNPRRIHWHISPYSIYGVNLIL